MAEDLQPIGDNAVQIMAAVADWQHVRLLGEDMVATELVLPENHRIGPSDLGAMAAAGLTEWRCAASRWCASYPRHGADNAR